MTQRIFDVENEKDMQDLWDILPDDVNKIEKYPDGVIDPFAGFCAPSIHVPCRSLIKINWHYKTEITRPVYEITDQDIGKICCFWEEKQQIYGKLHHIEKGILGAKVYFINNYDSYPNCRRLTKQEIEELC